MNEEQATETLLLVEDQEPIRRYTRILLEQLGYNVLEAPNAATALALAEGAPEPIHILLTDVVMPGMNGRELAHHFQRVRPDARVVFMSGYTDDAIFRADPLREASAFLPKPFDSFDLARALREALMDATGQLHG